ncbi:leucine aminopeptidase 2, chloroplastic [Artemisia annua]|uniref:Leucine aminopeptidase 2, chloroplastic n=1 Tax=Artemisia annua TaxID=35608 RepID=A0A2U1MG98_ARTAN|nr:leucine aminopeptidase 2, chloroplastic [Artemisia annua]
MNKDIHKSTGVLGGSRRRLFASHTNADRKARAVEAEQETEMLQTDGKTEGKGKRLRDDTTGDVGLYGFESKWVICIFTPSDNLAKEVVAASEAAGEKLWRLPMEESYWDSMKSGVADMVNTGGRQDGSITAALFLKHAVYICVVWITVTILSVNVIIFWNFDFILVLKESISWFNKVLDKVDAEGFTVSRGSLCIKRSPKPSCSLDSFVTSYMVLEPLRNTVRTFVLLLIYHHPLLCEHVRSDPYVS